MGKVLSVILVMLTASNLWAHKFKCFATYEDGVISGYAWLSTGSRPVSVPFDAVGPDKEVLYKGTTTKKGEFSFKPTKRVDHLIRVHAGEGHIASFTVYSEDIEIAEVPKAVSKVETTVKETAMASKEVVAPVAVESGVITEKMVAKAVSKEISKLRMDLEAFKERQRMQDVIGGVGYLLGFAGIAFYFLGVRRKENV